MHGDGAYIIYTSGSTGKPKGVIVPHRGVVRLVINTNYIKFKNTDRILQNIAIVFDASVFAIFGAFLNGLPLYPIQKDKLLDFGYLEKYIKDNKITIINLTVSLFNKLIDYNPKVFDKARVILIGGEAVLPKTVNILKKNSPHIEIVNVYGPTENSDLSSCHIIEKQYEKSVPIGKPVSNSTCYILDKNQNLLPIGVPGEICVGGDGVAIGYLNNQKMTEEKFIPNKFGKGKLYKTGDLGYWQQDGNIQFISRIDKQVKIRGFRIELKEIEAKILEFGDIQECAVIVVQNDSTQILVACIGTKNDINTDELNRYLKTQLPFYMVPLKYMVMENLPLNINGKLDSKKLLEQLSDIQEDMVKPINKMQEELVEIWKKVLDIKNVGINNSFFEVGGDSLAAITMSELLYEKYNIKIPVRDILNNLTIEDLASIIKNSKTLDDTPIKKVPIREYYPLSYAQKRVYYASKMIGEDNLVYNVPGAILIDKILNENKVEKCFEKIIENQSAFRTYFVVEEDDVRQKIQESVKFNVKSFQNRSSEMKEIIKAFPKPFDLENAPLLRVELHYLDNEKTLLLLDSHHIIMDGSSLQILINNFYKLYNEESIDNLEIEYKDYAVWENDFIESEEIKEAENYWINKFKDSDIPSINLPYDYSMPAVRTYNGDKITKKINKKDFDKYLKYAKELNVSPYMLFMSAFFVLLYKYTGQEEIILGSPTAGRDNYKLKNIIGMFVNNLVVDAKIKSDNKFTEFLNEIKEQVVQDLMYQNYPYDLLVKKLNLSTDNTRNPLFDVMFAYQNTGDKKLTIEGQEAEFINAQGNIAKFNLSFEIDPSTRVASLEYRTDLFKKETIERLFKHYINTLEKIVENKDIHIKDISIISETEKDIILNKFNDTKTDYPNNKTICQLFEEQVKKTPNNVAIVFEDLKMTYKELNEKANQLANYLKTQNLSSEDIICVLLDKSIEMIIAILAVLKNRCAYLPIDMDFPKERIDYIIKDSKSKILLTSTKLINKSNPSIKSICIDLDMVNIYGDNYSKENLEAIGRSHDLAYIMYTSGSTGNPKGVMIENKNVVRLVKNTNFIEFKENDKILQTGSIVFDACTFEIWGALLNGLELYIIKKNELLDASLLQDYILKNDISILWVTAPLLNQLCEENPHIFNSVNTLLTGGDILSPKHISMLKSANKKLSIINGYGPTENTTFSCCYNIENVSDSSIPIGKPIANSTCYIISQDGIIQPIGIPGELWVGGDGVGRGYFNNIELSKEKFINSPFDSTERIYKTGDLVKWLPDGNIEFLGRIDNQIKIRGFRVELSEITAKISEFEDIKEAFTIFDIVNDEKCICSYIVSSKKIDIYKLKEYLKEFLPLYMIPKYFMQVENLPINQNGKINKNLLPKFINIKEKKKNLILPTTKDEEILYNIFKNILNYEDLSITDDFFDIGGDSISAMRLQIEALKNNINISYSDIFTYHSVEKLAKCLNKNTISEKNEDIALYDYNILLKNNNIDELKKEEIKYTPINNILLTGFTGFLGAHILDSFIKKEAGIIYCLIREKNGMSAEERLKSVLHFYFNNKYDIYIGNRIKLVEGDITQENMGLSNEDYYDLGTNITSVIHSAALVKHYGNFKEFENININGTKKIIEFCKNFNLRLVHISTISVSGNVFAEESFVEENFEEDIIYDETNFYVGQNLDNLYVKSKFLAERAVLNEAKNGLSAYILRMGNLTSRYSEGKFQQNHFENAFVNRFKSILQIGCVPEYLQDGYVEFTPIDYCGDAIIDIANHYDNRFTIFHLLNDKHLMMKKLYKILNELGINIKIISSEEFIKVIDELLKDPDKCELLEGIVKDLNKDKQLVYESNIKIKSEFTREFLRRLGFEWPDIDKRYIKNYLKYLSDIGYFNINLN